MPLRAASALSADFDVISDLPPDRRTPTKPASAEFSAPAAAPEPGDKSGAGAAVEISRLA
jgi:hypothetical protein